MNEETIRVLMIEDNPAEIALMEEMLAEASGASFELADSTRRLSTGLERLTTNDIDVVLLDLLLPDSQGLETFETVQGQAPQVPIIVLSGLDDESLALEAVRKGAQDYLVKGQVNSRLLGRSIRYAIERHRTEKALKRRAAELSLLNDIGSRITSVLDWKSVLDRATHMMQETFGYYNIAILTRDEEKENILTVRASVGALSDIFLADPHVELERGMVGWVGSHGETLLVNDVAQEPRYYNPSPERIKTQSELSVPITIGGEVAGVIDIQSPELNAFDDNDQMVVETLADQIAVAMENARLYRSARQVDRLQVLSELDEALGTTLDPEKVAEITLEHIAAALDVSTGVVFNLSPKPGTEPVQAFVLDQDWVDMSFEERDKERLEHLLRRWEDSRKPIALSSEDLINLCPEGHQKAAERWKAHGILAPIRDEDEVVAILALGGRTADHPFTEEDQMLVQTAVSRVGQAMQNAWLYQASREKSERLSRLNAISSAAVSSLNLDTILHRVLEMTCDALDASEGSILLRKERKAGLRFAVTMSGRSENLVGKCLRPGQGIAGWADKNRRAVYVNNVKDDPRWYDGIDEETGFETHSLLCAPLEHQNRVTGVIEVVNKQTDDFNDEDLNLLEAVASIAATAIENARLYADTQARAEELALLNEIGLALTSTLDYEEVVREAASHVQRLFQADGTFLLQADRETGDLQFIQALSGPMPSELPEALSPDQGIVGWVFKRQQPLLLDNAQLDPRYPKEADGHLGIETHALMAAPMITTEGTQGLIAVLSEKEAAYDQDDLHMLQALSSTLTVALENARLYDEQKRLLREREETQAQLVHAEKMSALGRLAASIAHEINNPLQAVQGCLTLVDEEVQSDKREEKLERYLGIAGTEIDRIAGIVRRMRDFYRPSSQEFTATDVHEVLEGVLALANKQLQHADVVVERDWFHELPEVEANADHLKQVFLNMVLNAIDAMPDGGTLRVTTRPGRVQTEDGRPPTTAARIDFQDTGVGMSPDVQERLFEPFFTTKDHGSGLGLSISFNIVQSHQGEILVESEKGEGTTFSILLPVERTGEEHL